VPIQIDYPTGLGTEDVWGLSGAPNKLQAVGSNDGDSSIVYADSGGAIRVQRFLFPTIAGVADPVNDSDLYVRAREYALGVGGWHFFFQWNGVQAGSDQQLTLRTVPGNAYILLTHSAGATTLAAVNGEHGFQMSAAGGPANKWEVWVTEFYRTVDFTYPAGNAGEFAHLIGSLAASIGATLLTRDMMALARSIYRRTRVFIKPSEYEQALRAWRREKHVHLVGA
jgi:hypothetical protein